MKKLIKASKSESSPLADDPYGSNVLYLFRFNNDQTYFSGDGSTTSISGPGGGFSLNKKFGSHALTLGMSAYRSIYNPNGLMPGDFTLDWFYNYNGSVNGGVIDTPDAYSTGVGTFQMYQANLVYMGGATCYQSGAYHTSTNDGFFHYYSFRRSGNILTLHRDGSQIGNAVTKTGVIDLRTIWLNGGSTGWHRGGNGIWDSLRLTKGVARPVTVPTVEY